MKTLTVFTPTYNRAHTLPRLYQSLCSQTSQDFDWLVIDDGSTDETKELIGGFSAEGRIPIRYIHKDNGGLYTGYNVAYETIETELNVCIDSDDWMPEDAVERIIDKWRKEGSDQYAGIIGFDVDSRTRRPIGGRFPENLRECFLLDLSTKRIHRGDSKPVMRTDLMHRVAPQVGFPGEKNFNPVYMLLQVCDEYPLLVLNENLCFVEYQERDSMSKNILRQYIDSPRSFAKMRILEMTLKHNTVWNRFRCAAHFVAECLIAKDKNWLSKTPLKTITILAFLPGCLLYAGLTYKRHLSPR